MPEVILLLADLDLQLLKLCESIVFLIGPNDMLLRPLLAPVISI